MITKMEEIYKKLYSVIKDLYALETLSIFLPMEGSKYRRNEEKDSCASRGCFRLMVVGRCVNGWTEMPDVSADKFSIDAMESLKTNGFKWLRDDGQGSDTYIRKSDGKECRYNINRSAFWRSIRNVLKLSRPAIASEDRWFEYIVWSNLYPVAPRDKGNADGILKQAQFEQCKELLVQQIDFFDPTHILFITDWEGWFDSFAELFDVKKTGNSVNDNVVGVGSYNDRRIVVSIRPDRTRPNKPNEAQFAKDIVSAFL